MHFLKNAGQSSSVSSGDAVDSDVDAAPLHSGAASREGPSSDLCTASQYQGGQTFYCFTLTVRFLVKLLKL